MTLNCDLIRPSSAGENSFGVRKSSAVPIRNISLQASFNDGTSAAARAMTDGAQSATAPVAKNFRREILESRCCRFAIDVLGVARRSIVHNCDRQRWEVF